MAADTIATAADYADAMIVARRAKNTLFLLLLLMLLVQLALFFVARFTDWIITSQATTRPINNLLIDKLHYLLALSTYIGLVLPILLSVVLLLIVNIMLVGRLVGVARLTSAYLWCLVLALMLFPWQAFLNNATLTSSEFKIPGVLYTWNELLFAKFESMPIEIAILKWARFVFLPVAAVVILLVIHAKSNRGLRQALGEERTDINIST